MQSAKFWQTTTARCVLSKRTLAALSRVTLLTRGEGVKSFASGSRVSFLCLVV